MFKTDDIYPFIDALTLALELVDNFVQSIGGGGQVLLAFGNIATKVFSKQLAENITNTIQAYTDNKAVKANSKMAKQNLESLGLKDVENQYNKPIVDFTTTGMKYSNIMSDSQKTNFNDNLEKTIKLNNEIVESEAQLKEVAAATNLLYQDRLGTTEKMISVEKDAEGNLTWDINDQLMAQFATGDALTLKDAQEYSNFNLSDKLEGSINALGELSNQVEAYGSLQKQVDKDNTWGKIETNIDKTRESVKKLCTAITGIDDITAIENLDEAMKGASQEAQEMAKAIQKFLSMSDITKNEINVDKVKNALEEIRTLALAEQNAMKGLGKGNFIQNPEDLNRLLEMFNKAKIAADEQTRINEETQKGLELQAKLNNVIELASAVGDLAFAWTSFQELGSLLANDDLSLGEKAIGLELQAKLNNVIELASAVGDLAFAWTSFQELGSLLANDDLSLGEKAIQTVTNLSFTVMQLIPAIEALRKLKDVSAVSSLISNFQQGLVSLNAGLIMMGSGTGVAATGANLLSKAITGLLPGGKLLTLVLGGLVAGLTAFGFTAQAEKNRVEALAKSAEEASAKLQSIQEGKNNFDALYEQYKKGEASSKDLKAAAETLNNVLGDQSLKVATLAGNWEQYASKIDEAVKKEAQAQQATLKQGSWDAERNFVTSDKGTTYYGKNNSSTIMRDDYLNQVYQSQNALTKDAFGNWGVIDGSTAAERIQSLNKINNAYLTAIANASGEHQKLLEEEYNNFTAYSAQLSEERSAVESAWKNEAQGALTAFGDEEDFQFLDDETLEEYKQRLLETGKFSSEGAVEAFVEGMAAGNFDSSEAIASQMGQEEVEQLATANFNNKINNTLAAQNNNPDGLYQILESAEVDTTKYREQISNTLTQTILKQVSESGLSSEDQQTLLNNIDWSQPIEDILANLTKSINSNTTEVGNSVEFGSADTERHNDLINTYNIDENTIETYKELQEETTSLGDARDELAKKSVQAAEKAEEIKKSEGENSQAYKEATRDAKKAQKTLDAYNDTQEDLVELSLQSQKGMESLIESFEKNAKIIKTGDKNTLEYAEAIDQTRDSVADLVNTSKEYITPKFITDNFEDIEKAVNGDVDAIGRLRAAAANQILLDISKTGNLTEEELTLLQNKATELSNMTIEPYAQLDDTDFIAALSNMLSSGKMTAGQIQSYLNAIGYDPVISTKSTKYKAFSIPATHIPIEVAGFELGGINIPNIDVSGYSEVPVIESIQSSGGGGNYSPARSVATSPSRGGGGGGKKGGGSGGGKGYEPKENKDPIDNEVDRYEKVNTQLDAISANYEKINSEQERLTGDKLAKNLQKQNELLLRQIELYQEKLKIQQQEAEEVKNKLSSQFGITYDSEGFMTNYAKVHQQLIDEVNRIGNQYAGLGSEEAEEALDKQYEAAYDSEGFMTNYAKVHQQLIDEVNRIGNQYAGLGSEEAEEALDKQYEAAQKRLDTFEELYQRYDELLSSDLKDTIQQIEDLKDSIEDMRIEIFKTSVEALDNIRDIRKELAEFLSSDLKDTIQQIEDLKDSIEDMRIEIFKTSVEALDNIRDIRKELAEFNQSSKIWFDDDPFEKAKESVLQLGEFWDGAIDDVDKYYDELIAKEQEAANKATTSEGNPFEKAKESVLQLGEFWDGAIDDVDKYYDELIAKEQEAANKATTSEGKLYHNNRILQLQKAKADQGKESLDYLGTGFFDMQFSNVMDMMKEIEEFEKTGSSTVFGENSAAMYETALDVLKQANDMQFSNVMDMMKEIEEFEKTGSSTVFGENSAAMYETALDVLKQANSTLNDYKDNVTELRDLINDMLDEILEKQEERQNMYENINDELEHQIDLITIIHGEEAYDQLKQAYAAQLTNTKNQISEMNQTLVANNDMLDEILEKQEERQNMYENINDELEHQIDLITMIHGEEAYDQLKQAYAAQLTNTKNQISEMNQTLVANKELLAQMEAAGDTSSDAYKALKENIADTQKELNSLVQSSIENIRKQQELAVKSITDAWVKDTLGTDLDWMQTEWELINRNADYYLDDVNKAYNIQKLQGKYLELLDQSNDLGIQNQITAQMKEQLEYLREKKNLSEYDVQYANAQLEILQKRIALEEAQRNKSQMKLRRDSQGNYSYVYTANEGDVANANAQLEILQKRIALEEAQRNKSQMKLRRDSQGNYSYVYTANEGDVANAQSGLLDAQNNAYNLSKEQMKQTQADSLSALADAKSLIDSIWTNANLSLEEKKKRTETIIMLIYLLRKRKSVQKLLLVA